MTNPIQITIKGDRADLARMWPKAFARGRHVLWIEGRPFHLQAWEWDTARSADAVMHIAEMPPVPGREHEMAEVVKEWLIDD